jgi:putative transposase
VISLSAKGLTHGEIAAHLAEVYDAQVSKQTISTITDRVIEGMSEWQNRPLDPVYPVVFIDAIKRQDPRRQRRQPSDLLGVTVDGSRDVLGLWAGEHGDGEGSKYWLRVLSEIKNRGTQDGCIVVCDGLKGPPTAIESVWPHAITQTSVIHLLRNSFRYASKRDWAAIAKDLKLVYTAASESAALDAFVAFSETWGERYPAIIKLWENAWAEFVPFLAFDKEKPQRDLYDQQHRKPELEDPQGGERPRPLPIEQAALKCVYLAIMSIDPTGKGRKRWVSRWKAPLNAFELAFPGRLITSRN